MVLQTIIAKTLILVEAILEQLVEAPTYNAAVGSVCSPASFTSNGLTACGTAMVAQMGQLIVQGVGLAAGMLTALGVS